MTSVFPNWMSYLSLQQQSVLVLALRGPDGVRKHHPMKEVQRHYRASVIKAAKYDRTLRVGELADTFMSLCSIGNDDAWEHVVRDYFDHLDELPHHFHMHLTHGAQILGYKHPDERLRVAWSWFYLQSCDDAHMNPEDETTMDIRLGDWGQKYWEGENHDSG